MGLAAERTDLGGDLLAGVVSWWQRLMECSKIMRQSFADRLVMATQPVVHAAAATFHKMRVQSLEAVENRDRNKKIAPRKANQSFDLAFVVAPPWPAKPVLEQVVRLQFGKDTRSLTFAVPQDPRHSDLGVVVEN